MMSGKSSVSRVMSALRVFPNLRDSNFITVLSQHPVDNMTLLIRTTTEPLSIANVAKQAVYGIDPEQAVSNVTSADQLASDSIAGQRVSTALSGSLGGLALLLASIGVYGVMAYSVSRREREFGIRMAMGATPRNILSLAVAAFRLPGVVWCRCGCGAHHSAQSLAGHAAGWPPQLRGANHRTGSESCWRR